MIRALIPQREIDALAFARQQVIWLRDNEINLLGDDVLPFSTESSQAFALRRLKTHALKHPLHMMWLVDGARAGWRLADQALRELIIEYTDRGEQLPTYLGGYNMDLARGGPRHLGGPEKADTTVRDIMIALIVAQTAQRFGLRPTGRSPSGQSACEIVGKALKEANIKRGYKTIEGIWGRWGAPSYYF